VKKKKKRKGPWLQYIEYLIVLTLFRSIARLPYKGASDLGGLIGRIGYFIDRRHREISIKNLQMAFPEEDKKRILMIAKRSFENLGRSVAEVVQIAGSPPSLLRKTLAERVDIEGIDRLYQAIERGNGILLITAHFGNWELLGITLAAKGIPLNSIVRPLDNPWIDRLSTSLRSITGARVIPKKGSLREVLRRLRSGEGIGILIDQNTSRDEGVFVDFFGNLAATNKGPALIAMKSKAPVLPVFIIRKGRYNHKIVFGEEVPVHKTGRTGEDTVVNTQRFTREIESYIRRYPCHWFWMHRRWKTRPEAQAEAITLSDFRPVQ